MTNPTLITSTETSWSGWTVAEAMENVLKSRGLTLDSASTSRVLATTAEQNETRDLLRRATTEIAIKYPTIFLRRLYTATWTSGDHSIALPKNCCLPVSVFYGGVSVFPLSDEDYVRFIRSDASGGGVKSDSSRPLYYRLMGITEVSGGSPDPYYTMVLRLLPTPSGSDAALTLTIEYIARSPDFASADDAHGIELDDLYTQWIVAKAKEIWGQDENDRPLLEAAMAQRIGIEETLFLRSEGTAEFPDKVRWEFPTMPENRR